MPPSVPDQAPARKRPAWGFAIPFVLVFILLAGWAVLWFWIRGEAERRMNAEVARLQRAGYEIAWKDRAISGFPYRLSITLTEARVREPSGWALETPRLEAEAYLHAPTHWLFATPQGLTFVRPVGGPVQVTGKTLRASLTHLSSMPPSFSFQGLGLAFAPGPGAQPFGLTAAKSVEFHLRAGPDDEGGIFASLDQGQARLTGLLGRIAADKPISIVWNSTVSKMSAFRGPDWPSAARRWSDAGGRMTVRNAGITAGEALIGVNAGSLSVGADGRLRGELTASLREAPRALGVMGELGTIPKERADAAAAVAQARQADEQARATIHFEAGQITLGPAAIGNAPKVYSPR